MATQGPCAPRRSGRARAATGPSAPGRSLRRAAAWTRLRCQRLGAIHDGLQGLIKWKTFKIYRMISTGNKPSRPRATRPRGPPRRCLIPSIKPNRSFLSSASEITQPPSSTSLFGPRRSSRWDGLRHQAAMQHSSGRQSVARPHRPAAPCASLAAARVCEPGGAVSVVLRRSAQCFFRARQCSVSGGTGASPSPCCCRRQRCHQAYAAAGDVAMKRGRCCRRRDKARTATLPLSVPCCRRCCNEAGRRCRRRDKATTATLP